VLKRFHGQLTGLLSAEAKVTLAAWSFARWRVVQIKLAPEPISDQENRLKTVGFNRDVLRKNNFPTLAVWQNGHFKVWKQSVVELLSSSLMESLQFARCLCGLSCF
jgi:hypothetical protein